MSTLPTDPQGLATSSTYLDVHGVARETLLSTFTVRRLIREGVLPAFRVGRRKLLVRRADLVRVVESCAVGPRR
jgi:excisionase family DNA binding protein